MWSIRCLDPFWLCLMRLLKFWAQHVQLPWIFRLRVFFRDQLIRLRRLDWTVKKCVGVKYRRGRIVRETDISKVDLKKKCSSVILGGRPTFFCYQFENRMKKIGRVGDWKVCGLIHAEPSYGKIGWVTFRTNTGNVVIGRRMTFYR